ncbi:MAG: 50S ribosomal protein L17 [Clostridia bacterium]|jgi:large subunit ribosomal protein L17|nr:50S ribosomal protein L17 [Clostridia bacterium]MBQ6475112.1 50S ribosomal protein L17 [Clostridia bacterium]MBR3195863.1 50S ribosomal protein L17 [Clostridia bacterium]
MAMRKLGRPSDQRKAMLRGLVSELLWRGSIETTESRAKEVRKVAERIITLAMKEYQNSVDVEKTVTDENGKTVKVTVKNDMPSKLAARRRMMAYLYDYKEERKKDESRTDYRARTKDIKHPLVEKVFDELAPKYDKRRQDLGQGGGYTRIIKKGPRKGDAAETVIVELV